MVSGTPVYLRADGNSQIGLGHVHRLIALAEILKRDFDCIFLIRSPLPGIKNLISKASVALVEIDDKIPHEKEADELQNMLTGNEIIVLDGYRFDTEYQRNIKKKGSQLVCIDDIHAFSFVSDVVINPAGGIDRKLYSSQSFTLIYTGPAFAFLKEPFLREAANAQVQPEKNLLICMGGADPNNHTLLTLQHSLEFDFERFIVIIGEAYQYRNLLDELVRTNEKKIVILGSLSPAELAETMRNCGVAITSASGIAYEYLSVGGELYVKQTASNQEGMYHFLVNSGLAFPQDLFRVDAEAVQKSKIQQRKIFDRASDQRLLRIFKTLELSLKLSVRKAGKDDLLTLFRWANDPELRSQSYNTGSILLKDHTSWFLKKISDPNCLLYIFEFQNVPIAQVRFDIQGGVAVISYSIDKDYRGKGLGLPVLQSALKKFKEACDSPVRILGFVKVQNVISTRVFENLGFTKGETTEYPDSYRYEYQIL